MMLSLSVHMQEVGLTNGTPVETPSPASASVLFNRLQLDDDLDPDARDPDARDPYADTETHDLFVTVDDPKKHVSTMETYITYRVSTKVCYRLVFYFIENNCLIKLLFSGFLVFFFSSICI